MSHIVHVAAELAPIAKEGGLGDVTLGLGRQLLRSGHEVAVILPKYDTIELNAIDNLQVCDTELRSYYDNDLHLNTVWSGTVMDLPIYLIEPHHPHRLFERGCIYGCPDDTDRFLYFSRAALALMLKWQQGGKPVDIIHYHDWHAAATGPLYRDIFAQKGLGPARLICTAHNFQYQGQCGRDNLIKVGLEDSDYMKPDRMLDDNHANTANLLKGGVVYADHSTTVSKHHAEEVRYPEGGHGLDRTLNALGPRLTGIINGLDYDYWNPATDRFMPAHYSAEAPEGKKDCKRALQRRLGLKLSDAPIVGCVSRLVPQKGIDLILHSLYRSIEKGAQFVLLGTCPDPETDAHFQYLYREFSTHPDVHLNLHNEEDLAHQIFAASDCVIVPSIFEPCGLTQLIALRYGAIPVVRNTGGLSDTIFDVDYSKQPGNGFVFDDANIEGMNSALDRALTLYTDHRDQWDVLVNHGMNLDHSWRSSAKKYLDLYQVKGKKKASAS